MSGNVIRDDSGNVIRDDLGVMELQFTGEALDIIRDLSTAMERSPIETVANALSLYRTLLEWREKGNVIDMVTPARGETRDRLELP